MLPLVERELYAAEQTGMGMASAFRSETLKTGFLTTSPIYNTENKILQVY